MIDLELSAEARSVIAKVQKLLALANGNANENEASAASAKAMELLAAYNLDMAMVGKTAKGSQRNDSKLKGGLYAWQRSLWQAVSELNFCMYWSIKGLKKGATYEHRILGREENVIGAQTMAQYLQQTVERLAKVYARDNYPGASVFIKEMIAYREGMAARLVERLWALREERLAEDRRKRDEAAKNASGSNSLVLADVIQTEIDLNYDHLYGYEPGTTSKRRAEQKARQQAATKAYWVEEAKRKAEWDAFAAANPEEARRILAHKQAESDAYWDKLYKKEAKRNARRVNSEPRYRAQTAQEQRASMSTFYAGYQKADDIGLDRQVSGKDEMQRIGS